MCVGERVLLVAVVTLCRFPLSKPELRKPPDTRHSDLPHSITSATVPPVPCLFACVWRRRRLQSVC